MAALEILSLFELHFGVLFFSIDILHEHKIQVATHQYKKITFTYMYYGTVIVNNNLMCLER